MYKKIIKNISCSSVLIIIVNESIIYLLQCTPYLENIDTSKNKFYPFFHGTYSSNDNFNSYVEEFSLKIFESRIFLEVTKNIFSGKIDHNTGCIYTSLTPFSSVISLKFWFFRRVILKFESKIWCIKNIYKATGL